ncbi:MAG: hypothetical protein JWR16_2042 [Nevskia sp.]|nr:hypothetical protein [Nevskia sp.]
MSKKFVGFAKKQEGATAVEYGLIVALVILAIYTIVGTMGGSLNTKFTSVNTALTAPAA